MTQNYEVYSNSTLKQVIFQIKFPNLFFIESKIGDFQMKIMNDFPKSQLLFQQQIMFTELNDKGLPINLSPEQGTAQRKVWQFSTLDDKCHLQVTTDSISIISETYKTYNNPSQTHKFRDLIEKVVTNFLELIPIPILSRIGLRYIDECPIVEKNNTWFTTWYNTVFPLSRFNISCASEMDFKVLMKKTETCNIRYIESLVKDASDVSGNSWKLMLDFDGSAENIQSVNVMDITDQLHLCISEEYELTIKEPVREYMRGK